MMQPSWTSALREIKCVQVHKHMKQQSYSYYRLTDPLCTSFAWHLFKHTFLSGTSPSCPACRQTAITQEPISRTRLYWILLRSRLQLTLPGSNQHQHNWPSDRGWLCIPSPAAGPALVMDLISTTTALDETDPTRAGNIPQQNRLSLWYHVNALNF